MTFTPAVERLAVELSLSVFYVLGLWRLGMEHPTFRLQGERYKRLRNRYGKMN